jgi:hypothetical protein
MIDEAMASRAAETFVQVVEGRWVKPRTEIQENWTYVLLSVDVRPGDGVIDRETRRSVALALNAVVPAHPEQELGSWMVVFTRNGDVFDSILPLDF